MNRKNKADWKETLNIADRGHPDLYLTLDEIRGAPHAAAMRAGFKWLNLSGFFCIDSTPAVAFLLQQGLDTKEINRVHQALWNQGLASLLLVVLPSEIRAYSLAQTPLQNEYTKDGQNQDSRLVKTFDLIADAIEVSHLIAGVESGRFFTAENKEYFDEKKRVDSVLLRNLRETENSLRNSGLPTESAQALLIQVTFISYLEDRKIIDANYFQEAIDTKGINSLKELLDSHKPKHLNILFRRLFKDFNGDIFFAPCAFDEMESIPVLEPEHIESLADFRCGLVELETGQTRFWPYDFRFIPVELISAIYDRFLADRPEQRRDTGAYYTPRFLADLTVNQIWDEIPIETRTKPDFTILDPACGSAIFLVRIFQRMVEDWRFQNPTGTPRWKKLLSFVERLHGWDMQTSAVRIGIFSLYIALLEEVEPSAIKKLLDAGKILPYLFQKNMCRYDFFEKEAPAQKFDLVIGNPPWVSRKEDKVLSAIKWCSDPKRALPMPSKELAWAFIWKGLESVKVEGLIGFLLPAMGVLLNHNNPVIEARKMWLSRVRLIKVINFSDMRFLLFDGAVRPTALCIFKPKNEKTSNYSFDYWCPKADPLLQTSRMLTLNSGDKVTLNISTVVNNPHAWSSYMWMGTRDMKLLGWLLGFKRLKDKTATFRESKKTTFSDNPKPWIIGQGFKPANPSKENDESYETCSSEIVEKLPFLDANNFQAWVLPKVKTKPWHTSTVHRKGFETGFLGTRLLIPKSIKKNTGLLRASYTEQNICFHDWLQALCSTEVDNSSTLKLLAAILNSRFAAWFYFHETASLGAERELIHEEQLLELPFPDIDELPDPKAARKAKKAIIAIMDELLNKKGQVLVEQFPDNQTIEKLNLLVYQYYGLTPEEIIVIEDTLSYILPSIQPRRGNFPLLWLKPTEKKWREYAETLTSTLQSWLQPENYITASLIPNHPDLAVLELRIQSKKPDQQIEINMCNNVINDSLSRIYKYLPRRISRNFQLMPDLKVFIDDSLYLIKPKSLRYWLKSAALNDADSIAAEIFKISKQKNKG